MRTSLLSPDDQGLAKAGALLSQGQLVAIPTETARNDIRIVDRNVFSALDAYSSPRLVEYWDENPCMQWRYAENEMMMDAVSAPTSALSKMSMREEAKDYEAFEGDLPPLPELVSIDGSFKHGREHDKAGLIMPAQPAPGQAYREEFSLGNAEDVAEIVSVDYAYGVGHGLDRLVPPELAQRMCQRDCVVVKAYNLLDPGVFELKYYARGIGLFLETNPGERSSLQLVACNFDQRCVALPQP